MSPEMVEQVLHAMGKGVQKLRAETADAEDRVRALESETSLKDLRIERLQMDLQKARGVSEHLTKTGAERGRELEQFKQREPRVQDNLRRLDQLSLGVFNLMVELAGHRDTAKTKAERIALGHVVERLAEIRPPVNDAERSAIA